MDPARFKSFVAKSRGLLLLLPCRSWRRAARIRLVPIRGVIVGFAGRASRCARLLADETLALISFLPFRGRLVGTRLGGAPNS